MMKSRRQFMRLTRGAAFLPFLSRLARAETYPSRPVRVLVGFAAGGNFDLVARLLGQSLSDRLGQQFVIENRPGRAAILRPKPPFVRPLTVTRFCWRGR